MLTIGPHLSIADGFAKMGRRALDIGATTLAFFTRNPRGGNARAIDPDDVAAFRQIMASDGFGPVVAHAAYTLNAAAARPEIRDFARRTFADDMARMAWLPGQLYNLHPGSHVGQGIQAGIAHIADMLNEVLREDMPVTVLLETLGGKGSEIGSRFEELGAIIGRVASSGKVGVCLDTCHVWDAGYDIVGDLDGVLRLFDAEIGLSRLKAIHLNDSRHGRGSHADRHARIGEGEIGLQAVERIINHPALRRLPFVLETPNDLAGWQREIDLLRGLYRD